MQNVSELYNSIVAAAGYKVETKLCINIDNPAYGYDESFLMSVSVKGQLFSGSPSVGGTCARDINVEMISPLVDIPKRAKLAPYVRVTDGTRTSEWIPKGKYYVDSRSLYAIGGEQIVVLHGYDAMLFAESDYPPETEIGWPAMDIDVVREIAKHIGAGIDERVFEIITKKYEIQYPSGYSCREVLGFIGGMYAGNWCITDCGKLMLVQLASLPKETSYLVDNSGNPITFGGVRILV